MYLAEFVSDYVAMWAPGGGMEGEKQPPRGQLAWDIAEAYAEVLQPSEVATLPPKNELVDTIMYYLG